MHHGARQLLEEALEELDVEEEDYYGRYLYGEEEEEGNERGVEGPSAEEEGAASASGASFETEPEEDETTTATTVSHVNTDEWIPRRIRAKKTIKVSSTISLFPSFRFLSTLFC